MNGLPIELALQPQIDAALARLRQGSGAQCLSDFAFSNIFLFRHVHDYRFLPGEWPCVAGCTYDGAAHLMPLFDLACAPAPVLASMLVEHEAFYPVAQSGMAALDPVQFAGSQSVADADYVYRAASFVDYPGRPLASKRNQVRQFLGAHVPSCQPFDAGLVDAAHTVLREWMAQKGKAAGEADDVACTEALAHAQRFQLEGYVHFEHGRPIGFVLAQELQPGVFVMRFAKGLDSHVGVYPYMFQHFCRSFPRPVQWLNFEQDMGLTGFRRSKASYRPDALLRKWRVRLRPRR